MIRLPTGSSASSSRAGVSPGPQRASISATASGCRAGGARGAGTGVIVRRGPDAAETEHEVGTRHGLSQAILDQRRLVSDDAAPAKFLAALTQQLDGLGDVAIPPFAGEDLVADDDEPDSHAVYLFAGRGRAAHRTYLRHGLLRAGARLRDVRAAREHHAHAPPRERFGLAEQPHVHTAHPQRLVHALECDRRLLQTSVNH